MAAMTPPFLPSPIASLMLEDLRRAASYLDDLAARSPEVVPSKQTRISDAGTARAHAMRLWSASQAVERLVIGIEQMLTLERSRQAWTEDGTP
jgi:hypothetical protein